MTPGTGDPAINSFNFLDPSWTKGFNYFPFYFSQHPPAARYQHKTSFELLLSRGNFPEMRNNPVRALQHLWQVSPGWRQAVILLMAGHLFLCGFVSRCVAIVETSSWVVQLKPKHSVSSIFAFQLKLPKNHPKCFTHAAMTALYQKALSVCKYNLPNFSKCISTPPEEYVSISSKCSRNPLFYPLSCSKERDSGNLRADVCYTDVICLSGLLVVNEKVQA